MDQQLLPVKARLISLTVFIGFQQVSLNQYSYYTSSRKNSQVRNQSI
ncbi:hypothetical protein [Desemzia incerta]|nr:hypothetical protein [Desemzia incerta]